MLLAGEPVEGLELGRGQGQLAVLVLSVEGEQPRAERAQARPLAAEPVDEGARPPRRRRPAPERDLGRALGQALGDLGQLGVLEQALGHLEHSLDVSLVGPGPHDLRPRLSPG